MSTCAGLLRWQCWGLPPTHPALQSSLPFSAWVQNNSHHSPIALGPSVLKYIQRRQEWMGTATDRCFSSLSPIVHLMTTAIAKHWRTIIHSWASNPNPGTPARLLEFTALGPDSLPYLRSQSLKKTSHFSPLGSENIQLKIWSLISGVEGEQSLLHLPWSGKISLTEPKTSFQMPLKRNINQTAFVHLSVLWNDHACTWSLNKEIH